MRRVGFAVFMLAGGMGRGGLKPIFLGDGFEFSGLSGCDCEPVYGSSSPNPTVAGSMGGGKRDLTAVPPRSRVMLLRGSAPAERVSGWGWAQQEE